MKESINAHPVKRTQKDYSLTFKLNVVKEYEESHCTLAYIHRKYGIQGSHTLKRWIENMVTLTVVTKFQVI